MANNGKKSRDKGKRYEAHIAKLLSEWTLVKFRRTPCSGGFNKTGGVRVAERTFSGDIICDRSDFKFTVEAKNRESLSLVALLSSPSTCEVLKWWDQCVTDGETSSLMPMMFCHISNGPDVVVVEESAFESLLPDGECFTIPEPYFIYMGWKHGCLTMMTWTTFISILSPAALFLNSEDYRLWRVQEEKKESK